MLGALKKNRSLGESLITGIKNIQDDSNAGNCGINQKRVDDYFGPPEKKTDLKNREYRMYNFRKHVSVRAHGGITLDVETVEYIFWFIKGPDRMSWNEARDFCEEIGGKLFSNLDGSKAQLDSIYDLEEMSYWLGVYTDVEIQENQWKTVEGKLLDSKKFTGIQMEMIQSTSMVEHICMFNTCKVKIKGIMLETRSQVKIGTPFVI